MCENKDIIIISRSDVLRKDSFPGFGIQHDVTESLKSAVRYAIVFGLKYFRWKILSLSGSIAWVLMHLLLPLVTWSANVTSEVKYFHLISLDTNRVPREDVCLPILKWSTVG